MFAAKYFHLMASPWVCGFFRLDSEPGPFLLVRADAYAEAIAHSSLRVAFAFYRMSNGGVFTVFVDADNKALTEQSGRANLLFEMFYGLDQEDTISLLRAALGRESLHLCFAEGKDTAKRDSDVIVSSPIRAVHDVVLEIPLDCRNAMLKELDELLSHHQSIPANSRDFKESALQVQRENPSGKNSILTQGTDCIAKSASGSVSYVFSPAFLQDISSQLEELKQTVLDIQPLEEFKGHRATLSSMLVGYERRLLSLTHCETFFDRCLDKVEISLEMQEFPGRARALRVMTELRMRCYDLERQATPDVSMVNDLRASLKELVDKYERLSSYDALPSLINIYYSRYKQEMQLAKNALNNGKREEHAIALGHANHARMFLDEMLTYAIQVYEVKDVQEINDLSKGRMLLLLTIPSCIGDEAKKCAVRNLRRIVVAAIAEECDRAGIVLAFSHVGGVFPTRTKLVDYLNRIKLRREGCILFKDGALREAKVFSFIRNCFRTDQDYIEAAREIIRAVNPLERREDEPQQSIPTTQPNTGNAASVEFSHERPDKNGSAIYSHYKGPDKAAAIAFLLKDTETKPAHFTIVETPDGAFTRNDQGAVELWKAMPDIVRPMTTMEIMEDLKRLPGAIDGLMRTIALKAGENKQAQKEVENFNPTTPPTAESVKNLKTIKWHVEISAGQCSAFVHNIKNNGFELIGGDMIDDSHYAEKYLGTGPTYLGTGVTLRVATDPNDRIWFVSCTSDDGIEHCVVFRGKWGKAVNLI